MDSLAQPELLAHKVMMGKLVRPVRMVKPATPATKALLEQLAMMESQGPRGRMARLAHRDIQARVGQSEAQA